MGLLLYAFGGHSQPACRQISRNVPVGVSPGWFAMTTRLPLFRKIDPPKPTIGCASGVGRRAGDGRKFPTGSADLVQERLCLLQVWCGEAFGEPAVDRREEIAGFGVAALVAAEPGEALRGAQFPELGALLLSDAQGFAIQFLGGLGLPLPLQQLAFVPVQLCRQPALSCPSRDLQSVVQR